MIVSVPSLRSAMTLVATQTDEVTIRPDSDGWSIMAVSPDHVTLMKATIPTEAFTDYEVWETFAVKADDVLKSLPTSSDTVDIDISTGRLVMKADGYRYRKALLAPEENVPRMPSLNVETEVVTSVDGLLRITSQGDAKYGQVILQVTDEAFIASVEDEQGLGASLEIPVKDCGLLVGNARCLYPLSAWVPFLKALPKGAELDIQFDSDYPLTASYTSPMLTFTWMVAPHIVQED